MVARGCGPAILVALAAAGSAYASPASAQPTAAGVEFQVNAYTTGSQRWAAAAMHADGHFVLAWHGSGTGGFGVWAERYDASGQSIGVPFRVSPPGFFSYVFPAVAMDEQGDFVLVWKLDASNTDHAAYGRLYDSSGVALGPCFKVSSYTLGYQSWTFPHVAVDADGDFVVAWSSTGQDGSLTGVFARRYDSSGGALATEFQVNTYTIGFQHRADVAMDADGDFVVVWDSIREEYRRDVLAQRYASSGLPQGGEFRVNSSTTGHHLYASVDMEPDGDFVVAWERDPVFPDNGRGILARRFDRTGAPLDLDIEVASSTGDDLLRVPVVALDRSGELILVWFGDTDGDDYGIFGRLLDSAGTAQGPVFQVNGYTSDAQWFPTVAVDDAGDFVVAWESPQDGNGRGVFARRFNVPKRFDVDGSGFTLPLTDGILLIRFLFGFVGSTLTAGVVGEGCTRCDAAAVESLLAGLGALLDVDGDGVVGALTDGVLVLRYGFGLRGDALVLGAIGAGCARCSAEAIEDFIAPEF